MYTDPDNHTVNDTYLHSIAGLMSEVLNATLVFAIILAVAIKWT